MTSEKQIQLKKTNITRSDIDKATEINISKKANLTVQEISLGISIEESEAILNVLYKDKKAQRPN